ncbi:MAG: methylation-associated defense system protein MAD4 [Vicinamibacteria bacterium]
MVVLVADKNIEFALRGILARPKAVGMRSVFADIFIHPERDAGCFSRGEQFLRSFSSQYDRGLLVLDRDGSGRDDQSRETLETELESRLAGAGWADRARAIVIEPELEIWVWAESPHVEDVLGWKGRKPDLRRWLKVAGFVDVEAAKPGRPKSAMQEALRIVSKPRSSVLYSRLAERVSYARCTDPAFDKLRSILGAWFPPAAIASE